MGERHIILRGEDGEPSSVPDGKEFDFSRRTHTVTKIEGQGKKADDIRKESIKVYQSPTGEFEAPFKVKDTLVIGRGPDAYSAADEALNLAAAIDPDYVWTIKLDR